MFASPTASSRQIVSQEHVECVSRRSELSALETNDRRSRDPCCALKKSLDPDAEHSRDLGRHPDAQAVRTRFVFLELLVADAKFRAELSERHRRFMPECADCLADLPIGLGDTTTAIFTSRGLLLFPGHHPFPSQAGNLLPEGKRFNLEIGSLVPARIFAHLTCEIIRPTFACVEHEQVAMPQLAITKCLRDR